MCQRRSINIRNLLSERGMAMKVIYARVQIRNMSELGNRDLLRTLERDMRLDAADQTCSPVSEQHSCRLP